MSQYFITSVILLFIFLTKVESHGYLSNPPARNAAWKYGFKVPPNYDVMSLNCGGRGSKCSVCGDNFFAKNKPHETGGTFAKGVIVKTYTMGSTIDVEITITANHQGYFQFKVCPVTNNNVEVTQDCLDKNVLVINGNSLRRNLAASESVTKMTVKLPNGLTCERCVLQWHWIATITQEDYFNCADIRIVNGGGAVPNCKPEWDNSCTSNSQCCTGFCDNNNGAWTYGVCKKTANGGGVALNCKPEWDNSCTSSSQCCTGFCDNNNGAWTFGVCKRK